MTLTPEQSETIRRRFDDARRTMDEKLNSLITSGAIGGHEPLGDIIAACVRATAATWPDSTNIRNLLHFI